MILCLFSFIIKAQNSIVFDVKDTYRLLNNDLFFLTDSNNSISGKQIIEKYRQAAFTYRMSDLSKYSNSSICFVLDIDNKKNDDIFLLIKPISSRNISFYTVVNNQITDSIIGQKNKISYYENAAIFKINKGKAIYFVKIESKKYIPLKISVLDRYALMYEIDKFNLLMGLILGLLFITFFYHLIIYFFVREALYIYYLSYVFFVLVLFSSFFVFEEGTAVFEFFNNNIILFIILSFFSAILFVREFLISYFIFAKQKVFFSFFFVSGILIILFSVFTSHIIYKILDIYTGLLYLYLFFLSVYILKKNELSSIIFAGSWLVLLFVYTYIHINYVSFSAYDISLYHSLIYANVLNIIFLSLVVADRLNMYRIRQKKAHEKELKAIRERDAVIAAQQDKLKKIVAKRNKEILIKIEELENQQIKLKNQTKDITEKNTQILILNKELEIKNKKIEEQNKILKNYKKELEKVVEKRKKQLQIEKKRAEAANQLKTSFLSNFSKEIKTPLNSISDFASALLYKELGKKERDEYLYAILHNTETLLSLIEDVITLSRLQSGITKIKKSEIILHEFIHSLVENFNEKLFESGKNNLQIKAKIPKHNDFCIYHDYDKLWQIFKQLISNAIQFTEKGFIEIAYSVKMKDSSSGLISFYVKDTGKGMSEQEINDFLFRYKNNKYNKKGLGLAIIRELVKLLGGTIRIMSELDKGSIFYIEFETEVKT